ncbi:MAG: hypothetical protein IJV72_00470 [Clostridia bacterium]|nr:hypothetical protein [Clostridia bacterium]
MEAFELAHKMGVMDFGYGFFKNQRTGYKVATLDEVYELFAPLDMIVNVEIKEKTPEIIKVCDTIAKRHKIEEKLIYSCFNHYQIRKVKEIIPNAFIAPLHAWTADKPEDIQMLLDNGVDVIMTNYPDVALNLRDSAK